MRESTSTHDKNLSRKRATHETRITLRRDQCGLQLTKKIFIKKIRLRWLETVEALDRGNEIDVQDGRKHRSMEVEIDVLRREAFKECVLPISGGWDGCDKTTQNSTQRSLNQKPVSKGRHST